MSDSGTHSIDRTVALHAAPTKIASSWTADDVIVYQLGLGAGARPDDAREVRYVHEESLCALPTFVSVPASTASARALEGPGLELDLRRVLHVEQHLEVFGPVPAAADATNTAVIESIADHRRGTTIAVAVETRLDGGVLLARTTFHLLAQHRTSAVSSPSQAPNSVAAVERAVDHVMTVPTLPQQAAWFRLSSDRTAAHIDPAVARELGLERPTLQGLCTWGMVAKAVIDGCLGGDVDVVGDYRGRFTGMVFPGETLELRASISPERESNAVHVEVSVVERGAPAMAAVLRTRTPTSDRSGSPD